jgi:hypothetical protein
MGLQRSRFSWQALRLAVNWPRRGSGVQLSPLVVSEARFPWRSESPLSLPKLRGSLTIATTKTTRPLTTIYTLLGFNGYSSVQNRS